jgi:hypothetical protein
MKIYITPLKALFISLTDDKMPLEDKSKFKLNLFANSVRAFRGCFAQCCSGMEMRMNNLQGDGHLVDTLIFIYTFL